MVAVWGCDHGRVIVGKVFANKQLRAVGQDDVVFGEAFVHRRGRRHYDHAARTEPERENGTVFLGKAVESSVDWRFDEMEVADNWERRWARWEVFIGSFRRKEEFESEE